MPNPEDEMPTGPPEEENRPDALDDEMDEEDLIKILAGEVSAPSDENKGQMMDGPIDTEDKFITTDLIELPPKWFYEIVRDKNLPRGLRLTEKMISILDKVYLEGATKMQLVGDYGFPSSTVNLALRRVKELWKMYKAGTLALDKEGHGDQQSGLGGIDSKTSRSRSSDVNSRVLALTGKTTTFREIDSTIAQFLRPQIERSTQFQDVMARIGMVTTYAMMQLGVLDRSKFVTLAEAVTNDPENLYKYVASQLDALINVVDAEKLRQFTKELLMLREMNKQLAMRVEELEYELEKHKNWLYEAGLILARVLGSLPYKKRVEVAEWYLKYQMAKGGGLIATRSGPETESGEE